MKSIKYCRAALIGTFSMLSAASTIPVMAQEDPARVAVVSVDGEIGVDFNCRSFDAAIAEAVKNKVSVLFFVWDSGGGDLSAAVSIAETMNDAPDSLRVVSVIQSASGEAVCALASSDSLVCVEGDGDPIEFPENDSESGSSASMTRAELATLLAGFAESNGQPGGVYRAMVDPAARFEGPATSAVGLTPLSDGSDRTVLSITKQQAASSGFAVSAGSIEPEDLAHAIGLNEVQPIRQPQIRFRAMGRIAKTQIAKQEKMAKDFEKAVDRANEVYGMLQDAIDEANAENPKGMEIKYYYDPEQRKRYIESLTFNTWTRKLRAYRGKLTTVQQIITEAAKQERQVNSKRATMNKAMSRIADQLCVSADADESDWEFSSTKKKKMEDLWSFTVEQFKWCDNHDDANEVMRLVP